ncbi:MAG TPA: PKD domain-containing protein, partial [Myxococcales bacterium]|nr:PKD domain-containing protein [Myxococcales bacterium]
SLGAATRLAFSAGGVQTLTAGACSAQVTLQSRNASNGVQPVIADTAVDLATTSTLGHFYSDATCTNQIGTVTILNGTSSATFRWKDDAAGTPTLTASTPGMLSATAVQTVNAGAPTHLDFVTSEQTLGAGTCSEITTIQTADNFDNASRPSSNQVVALSSSSPGASFYSDAACTTGISSVTINTTSTQASFYWKDTIRGRPTLTVSSTGLTAGTQLETVGGRDQVSFRWYSSTGTPLAAERGMAAVAPGTRVHLRLGVVADGFPWKVAPTDRFVQSETAANAETVTGSYTALSADDTTYEVLTETKVGTGQNAYRTLGNPLVAGSTNHVHSFGSGIPSGLPRYDLCLIASTTGEPLQVGWAPSASVATSPAFPGWQITSAALVETCFDLKAQGYAGGPLTVYLKDAFRGAGTDGTIDTFTLDRIYVRGNPPVYLGVERATLADFSDAVLVPAGELWDDAANANGARLTSALTGTAVPEVFVETRPSLPANQQDVSTGQQAEWDFSVVFPATAGTYLYRVVYTDASGAKTGTVETTTEPAAIRSITPPAELRFSSAAQRLTAGACSGLATVDVYDASGNPTSFSAGATVSLSSTSGTLRFYSNATCTTAITSVAVAAGGSQAGFYFRDTTAGTWQTTATSGALTPANQSQIIDPAAPARVAFVTTAQTVTAGGCSGAATIHVQDQYGNDSAAGAATALTLSSTSVAGAFYTSGACSTLLTSPSVAAGTFTFTLYYRDTLAGTPTVRVDATGLSFTTQVETIIPAAASTLLVAGFPSPAQAGVPANFTVTARDAYLNTASGYRGTVSFTSTDAAAALPAAFTFTATNNGIGTFQATLKTLGTQSLTARDGSGTPTGTQSGISVIAGPAAALQVTGVTSPITAGAASDVVVTARDSTGNTATGYTGTIRFTSSDAQATLPASYAFTAGDSGRHTFTGGVRFGTAGTQSVTATDQVTASITGTQGGIQVVKALGSACAAAAECGSGFCIDQVCCNNACGAACQACNLTGLAGTCSPEPDGTACPNALYCDGTEVCRTGACTAGAPVSCVDPDGLLPLRCDETARACVEQQGVPPAITHDANPVAAVGIPYRYNAAGSVTVRGSRPLAFASCGAGVAAFRVDPLTGSVSWTPSSLGPVALCVGVSSLAGSDQYQFTVTVQSPPTSGPPVAQLTAAPLEGQAPLVVTYDGSASSADPTLGLLGYEWDFGDWSPLAYGAGTSATFLLPGGWQTGLTVIDGAGRQGSASAGIRVLDAQNRRPPLGRIVASAVTGTDSLDVQLSCNCQPGDAAITGTYWDFGDGAGASAATAAHTFLPGRYRVRMAVVDGSGLVATDSVEVVVNRGSEQPPQCRLFLRSPAGAAPLTVRYRPTFGDPDGTVATAVMTFSDGTTSSLTDVSRTYADPGRYPAQLEVTDDSGLRCRDRAEATALNASAQPPPSFLSAPPSSATCGVEWKYADPGVAAEGARTFTLSGFGGGNVPSGMTVDAATGTVTWLPSSNTAGTQRVVLRVETAAGTADQVIQVDVACGPPQTLGTGCGGCSAGATAAAGWISVVLCMWLMARRRRLARARARARIDRW